MTKLEIRENIPLSGYTTFKVGGPARYFVEVKTVDELHQALALAREKQQPVFVLAGGSNLIISAKGFNGLVISIKFGGLKFEGQKLTAGAAVPMATLIDASIEKGLAGLEWAGGLPGSYGGAIRGNAGAYGGEIKDVVQSVTSVNHHTGVLKHWSNSDCQFEYRGSIFKRQPNEVIILATLSLKAGDKNELRQIADDHIRHRHEKHPMEHPNAGSIFKNVRLEKVPKEFLPLFETAIKTDPFPIVPTARILDVAGLKELRSGQAEVSSKMPNFIVNRGGATGEDIVELIKKVQTAIREKYSIELEVEPELVGF